MPENKNFTLLHTADWHLGHHLHGVSRYVEHAAFLKQLLAMLKKQKADALLVSGDIFDTANPSASAIQQLNEFIVRAHAQNDQLQIILTAGNHDSASRLESLSPLLKAYNTSVVGQIIDLAGQYDPQKLIIPLRDATQKIQGWCVAMPFLRPADLERSDQQDGLIEGVRERYQAALQEVIKVQEEGQFLVAMGHCYMVNSKISELSERRILGGNQHALPVDIFADNWDYVALGHLHLAQKIKHEHIRYSGSPIPLSMGESGYSHQIVSVQFRHAVLDKIEALHLKRSVEMLRIPKQGSLEMNELISDLECLELDDDIAPDYRPFLEVHVRLEKPESGLKQNIENALKDKAVRLVKITTHYPQREKNQSNKGFQEHELQDLKPEQVFIQCYQRSYSGEPEKVLTQAFNHCVDSVEQGAEQ
ncbi:MAG: exonuclease SbcCD subunit D C-terminal domain-containing protein [bacterium]